MQHVGVAEEDRSGAPQERPLVLRRVAVIDRRNDAADMEAIELARLVLGEGLGGEEEEGPRLRVGGEGLEDGELVAEALAARRPGAHDHVLAGRQQLSGGGLMAVERAHAGREERFAQRGRQVLRKLGGAASTGRLVRHRHDLLVPAAGEERLERAGCFGGHAGVVVHDAILLRSAGRRRRTAPARQRSAGQGGRPPRRPAPDDGPRRQPLGYRPLGPVPNAKGALARPPAQPSLPSAPTARSVVPGRA